MLRSHQFPFSFKPAITAAAVLAALVLTGTLARSSSNDVTTKTEPKALPAAFEKAVPESVEDLKAIQKHIKSILPRLILCTVNVKIGAGQGSGVIVSEDGYVLTAGHVSGKPGRDVILTLHNGRTVKGKTLGNNGRIDSGMIKITEGGKWPFVDMGTSGSLKKGEWCMAIGHPGGDEVGRSPVVRVGRVLDSGKVLVRTDCTLVGGDSGGPLFDMRGKVIGIHSRISGAITANIHVPVDTYRETWDQLAAGDAFGGAGKSTPYLGVQGDPEGKECKILVVAPGSPAEKAGLKVNDVVRRFAGNKIVDFEDLVNQVQRRRIGEEVRLEVQRGEETVSLKIVVGKR